jgi:superfamily II DNA helicase RecQ
LFVTPELLHANPRAAAALAAAAGRSQLSLLAVDEAHCVIDWGASCSPFVRCAAARTRTDANSFR